MGLSKSTSKREVYSNAVLPQEIRKISNNLTLHVKQLEKEQTKSKDIKRKGAIKIRTEKNEVEAKKTTEKINETKSRLFEKINKRLIKKKRERTQINKIRNEKGKVTMDSIEIEKIIRDFCEELYATIGH